MIDGKEILTPRQEVLLQAPPQPAFSATVTEVDSRTFWTNLPRDRYQILVLTQRQKVQVGISLKKGFYTAEATVYTIGNEYNKFYEITLPEQFEKSQERKFIRANYSADVFFTAGNLTVRTELINFSAGGIMVYWVLGLGNIVESGHSILLNIKIDGIPLQAEVRLAWQKSYDDIPFAGFEFINTTTRLQAKLAGLAIKHYT